MTLNWFSVVCSKCGTLVQGFLPYNTTMPQHLADNKWKQDSRGRWVCPRCAAGKDAA